MRGGGDRRRAVTRREPVAENSLTNLPVAQYLVRLASDAPTPGGGSVAALTGALAAALGQMACALTLGRARFAAVESQVRELSNRFGRARSLLEDLIDEDADAYAELFAALRIPGNDPQRQARIAAAACVAATVPLETACICHELAAELATLRSLGNPNLAADMESALHLASAARRSAVANVRANLPLLAPSDRDRLERELSRWSSD
jgi:formiminotetrahydrofolate cyclodeaminase